MSVDGAVLLAIGGSRVPAGGTANGAPPSIGGNRGPSSIADDADAPCSIGGNRTPPGGPDDVEALYSGGGSSFDIRVSVTYLIDWSSSSMSLNVTVPVIRRLYSIWNTYDWRSYFAFILNMMPSTFGQEEQTLNHKSLVGCTILVTFAPSNFNFLILEDHFGGAVVGPLSRGELLTILKLKSFGCTTVTGSRIFFFVVFMCFAFFFLVFYLFICVCVGGGGVGSASHFS